jgi:UDP-glucose 6-dehydrogenase
MKLGIIGMGIVGGTTAKVLSKSHKILPYDKYKQEYNQESILKESEAVFVCVPTPMKAGGEIDYSAIHNSLEMLTRVTQGIPENEKFQEQQINLKKNILLILYLILNF